MKIAVIGTRGFPGIQGGIETHCEQLYTRLGKMGVHGVIFRRSPHINLCPEKTKSYENIEFVDLWSPRSKHLENIIHSFLAILKCRRIKPDLIHVHGIGPSILCPLIRWLGIRCIMTHHGPDYLRVKWGGIARLILRTGEKLGFRFCDAIISISEPISSSVPHRFQYKLVTIPNGVTIPEKVPKGRNLQRWNLESGRYLITACRFVPEKRIEDIITAFSMAQLTSHKLVIAGDAEHEMGYREKIRQLAESVPGVVLTGSIGKTDLAELYSHAALFILASSYEGLPISLLEALSYQLPVLVSDIPANRQVNLNPVRFFKTGDVDELSIKIKDVLTCGYDEEEKSRYTEMIRVKFDWDSIAGRVYELYKRCTLSSG